MEPLQAIPLVADVPNPIAPLSAAALPSYADSSREPLAGTWLYSKVNQDAETGKSSSYRPVYIEMVVKAMDGHRIAGRYLGRLNVPDQALSSEVRFTFEGMIAEGPTVLPWRSGDGSEGQVRMHIVSDDQVEVTWYTTHFGTTRSLASGIAVLRRD